MQSEGAAYLAVPNRWMLIEPHYRLAFLSWLPRSWRSIYLRMAGRGEYYDCEPLEMRQLERMLLEQGFDFQNQCIPALRLIFQIERPDSRFGRLLASVPDFLLRPLLGIVPTLIYTIRLSGNERIRAKHSRK